MVQAKAGDDKTGRRHRVSGMRTHKGSEGEWEVSGAQVLPVRQGTEVQGMGHGRRLQAQGKGHGCETRRGVRPAPHSSAAAAACCICCFRGAWGSLLAQQLHHLGLALEQHLRRGSGGARQVGRRSPAPAHPGPCRLASLQHSTASLLAWESVAEASATPTAACRRRSSRHGTAPAAAGCSTWLQAGPPCRG